MLNSNVELVRALDKIRLANLYVHNDELEHLCFSTASLQSRKVYLVETLAVINALVDKGTMLLFGGHGGGKTTLAKYLGQLFYGYSKNEIEDCILRGHPQLTEEKILGTLDIAQLTRAKELNAAQKVDVIWNDFVDSPWKIIDELNRLSPYAQNILLSLLAESSVKYHNESKRLPNFSLYATMNPKDEGNFVLSLPFLDRFALALPITMPDYESLSTIGKSDKSTKQDDLSTYLVGFDLKAVQEDVKEVKYSEEAELFINVILSSYRLCERISKESNDSVTVDRGLCNGCHFNAPEKVCNKIVNPLSVRVKEDLYRYGKALAWYLGDSEVQASHIQTLAPFIVWHRSSLSKTFKQKLKEERFESRVFSLNIELDSTKELIDKIWFEFEGLLPLLRKFERVKRGKLSLDEFKAFLDELKSPSNNFLITIKEIIPMLEGAYAPVYNEIVDYNKQIEKSKTLEQLSEIKQKLADRYDIPNRQYLAELIEKERRKIGSSAFTNTKFRIMFDGFIELVSKEGFDLYRLINARFNSDFNPSIRKTEVLSDLSESEFNLTMEKINEGSGNFALRFVYRGDQNNSIYRFLSKYSVG